MRWRNLSRQHHNEKNEEPRAKPVACDIASKKAVKDMHRLISDEKGGVDILINNAVVYGLLEEHS